MFDGLTYLTWQFSGLVSAHCLLRLGFDGVPDAVLIVLSTYQQVPTHSGSRMARELFFQSPDRMILVLCGAQNEIQ